MTQNSGGAQWFSNALRNNLLPCYMSSVDPYADEIVPGVRQAPLKA